MKFRATAKMSSKPEERQRLAAKFEDDAEIRTVQPGIVTLNVPEDDGIVIGGGMKKSNSMASLRAKIRDKREKFRQNQCAGMIMFLIFGGILNILAYFASVWSAQLNADVVKAAVENEHALTFRLKKAITEAPSKYLIALLNFGGRVLSAVGTIMLVQVITTYCKRRKQYSILMKSATEEADTAISDAHVDCTDTAGECCLACMQTFS